MLNVTVLLDHNPLMAGALRVAERKGVNSFRQYAPIEVLLEGTGGRCDDLREHRGSAKVIQLQQSRFIAPGITF